MPRTVFLDEREQSAALLCGLKQMRQEGQYCDFTIRVGQCERKAHRIILAVCSPYFRAMLKPHTKESQDGEVEMKGVDFECVASCIDSMYSASFDIPDGKIVEVINVANLMQLDNIKNSICKALMVDLNAKNFFETRAVAEIYALENLSSKCKIHYEENMLAISSQPGFENEEKSRLLQVLNSENLNVSEEDKLTVAIRWVGKDIERKDDLEELLKLVKLQEVSAEYLSDLLENHPFINNDLRLYRLMNAPLVASARTGDIRSRRDNNHAKTIVMFNSSAKCIQAYDAVSGKVAKFHDESFPSGMRFTAISMDWYIYVLREDKSVHRLDYRSKTSKWERMQDVIADHGHSPPAVACGGSIVLIAASGHASRAVDIFEPDTNRCLSLKDREIAVFGLALVSVNNSVYCVGGSDVYGALRSLWKFTPSTSQWADLQPMAIARTRCCATVYLQKIFVMAGVTGISRETATEVECYDVTTGHWSMLAPFSNVRGMYIGHAVSGSIFLIDRKKKATRTEIYDIANNAWTTAEFRVSKPFLVSASVTI